MLVQQRSFNSEETNLLILAAKRYIDYTALPRLFMCLGRYACYSSDACSYT